MRHARIESIPRARHRLARRADADLLIHARPPPRPDSAPRPGRQAEAQLLEDVAENDEVETRCGPPRVPRRARRPNPRGIGSHRLRTQDASATAARADIPAAAAAAAARRAAEAELRAAYVALVDMQHEVAPRSAPRAARTRLRRKLTHTGTEMAKQLPG